MCRVLCSGGDKTHSTWTLFDIFARPLKVSHITAFCGILVSIKVSHIRARDGIQSHIEAFLGYSSSILSGAQKYPTYALVLGYLLAQQVPRHKGTETHRNRGAHRIKAQASVALSLRYICI